MGADSPPPPSFSSVGELGKYPTFGIISIVFWPSPKPKPLKANPILHLRSNLYLVVIYTLVWCPSFVCPNFSREGNFRCKFRDFEITTVQEKIIRNQAGERRARHPCAPGKRRGTRGVASASRLHRKCRSLALLPVHYQIK